MNHYVLARNAVIATALVLLFMISLQPERVSSVIMNMTNTVTNTFIDRKQIVAAEKTKETDNSQNVIKFDSFVIMLPESLNLKYEKKENAVMLSNDESEIAMTVEEYRGDIPEKAKLLAHSIPNNHNNDISIRPVLRGSNMYVEVSTSDNDNPSKLLFAVHRINDDQILVIAPDPSTDGKVINELLSGMSFQKDQ